MLNSVRSKIICSWGSNQTQSVCMCVFICVWGRGFWGMPGMSIVQFGKEWWGADYCVSRFLALQISVLRRSPGAMWYKKKSKTTGCVCVSVLFNQLSVCGKFPLRIEYVWVCVCVWAHKSLCDRVKQAFTNKKNNKRNKTARRVERDEPGCQRRNSLPGRMFQMNTNKQNCEIE